MKKTKAILICTLAVLLMLCACRSEEPAAEPKVNPTAAPVVTAEPEPTPTEAPTPEPTVEPTEVPGGDALETEEG